MIETITKKIQDLESISDEIESEFENVSNKLQIIHNPQRCGFKYFWDTPNSEVKKTQRIVLRLYQRWYSTSLQLITENLVEERLNEFKNQYPLIINFLQFNKDLYKPDKLKFRDNFLNIFDIQRGILNSIPDVLEAKELNLRNLISADYVEKELEEAEILLNNGFVRAAGALAGVALEKHLQTICYNNNVEFGLKETIYPLAMNLYKSGKIDISELKKIEYWASIRNKCDHPEDITENEVNDLLNGLKKFL
ncbi:MAG: hypothetical protein Q8M06_02815 [Methanobacteriaceae archaeon]|nr:hypothetical protein [Methanobacteriaceae archaeon]